MSQRVSSILDPEPPKPPNEAVRENWFRRIQVYFALAVAGVLTWIVAVLWFDAQNLFAIIFIAAFLITAGVTLLTFILKIEDPYFLRLLLIRIAPVLAWSFVMIILAEINDDPAFLIAAGSLLAFILLLVRLLAPTKVVEIEPGQVCYFKPYNKSVTQYEFIFCPISNEDQPDIVPDIHRMPFEAQMQYTANRAMKPPPQSQPSAMIHNSIHLWIRPLDEIREFWRLSEKIMISEVYRDLTTQEGMSVEIYFKAAFSFEPYRIKSPEFAVKVPKLKSIDQIKTIFQGMLKEAIDQIVRAYYVSIPFASARTTGSVNDLRDILPEKLAWADELFGLKIKDSSINIDPRVDNIVRTAASYDAARFHAAQAELSVADGLIDRAANGSLPAQLILYAYLFSNQRYLTRTPGRDDVPELSAIDRLMHNLQQGDADAREIIQQLLQRRLGTAPSQSEARSPLDDPAPQVIMQQPRQTPPADTVQYRHVPPSESSPEPAPTPQPTQPSSEPPQAQQDVVIEAPSSTSEQKDMDAAHKIEDPPEAKKSDSKPRRPRNRSFNLGKQRDDN